MPFIIYPEEESSDPYDPLNPFLQKSAKIGIKFL